MSAHSSDIVPIQLSVTAGDLLTLWAPRWREDGEEWEAFLGDEDALFTFPDAAALAAFVRTVDEHDLRDHPAWSIARGLTATELVPEEGHCYDIVGVPEIVADEPDTWTIGELAEIVTMVRSLADTCGLSAVHEVLDAAPGFAMLEQGSWAFGGREGAKLWDDLADTVARRWDEVIDALDAVVRVPEVDAATLEAARLELTSTGDSDGVAAEPADDATSAARPPRGGLGATGREESHPVDAEDSAGTETGGFWEEIGIDPILISTADGDHYTLRCYLDDRPVFLGSAGRIDVLPSARALARHLAGDGMDGHDLTRALTWPELLAAATSGELDVDVDAQNTYLLTGLGEDLADGPTGVDPNQLDLGVELLLDVGDWAGDETARLALAPSQSLGWLTSFVLRPDPARLAPSPPFDAEAGRWNALVDDLSTRLRRP